MIVELVISEEQLSLRQLQHVIESAAWSTWSRHNIVANTHRQTVAEGIICFGDIFREVFVCFGMLRLQQIQDSRL